MANNFLFAQLQPFSLAGSGAVIGDTSITLKTMTDIDGNALTMAGTFGTMGFGTLDPGNGTLEEQVVFTGLVNNSNGTTTLTGIKSVSFVAPYTQTSGLLKTHAGSTPFIISNTSGFYNELTSTDDDETIRGTWTFTNPNYPRIDTTLPYPTDLQQFATKGYADSLTFAGAPDASPTQKGIVEIATQAEVDAKTIYGGTSAYLVQPLNTQRSTLLSDYVLDLSSSANVIVISPSPAVTSYQTGQQFSFKLSHTNTSPIVTLNVNGLGAKNITKLNGSTSPAAGDMASGQMIVVEYDGTNFQMQTPVANPPVAPANPVQGDITYYDGSTWNRLAAGTSPYVLTTHGAGQNPTWSPAISSQGTDSLSYSLRNSSATSAGMTITTNGSERIIVVYTGQGSTGSGAASAASNASVAILLNSVSVQSVTSYTGQTAGGSGFGSSVSFITAVLAPSAHVIKVQFSDTSSAGSSTLTGNIVGYAYAISAS